jgi:hypothetical protein
MDKFAEAKCWRLRKIMLAVRSSRNQFGIGSLFLLNGFFVPAAAPAISGRLAASGGHRTA